MFKIFLLASLLLVVVTAQNSTCTSTQNRGNCFNCLSSGACIYCSTLGCLDNTQTASQTCTNSEGSTLTLQSTCPDPCYNPDNSACTDCMSASCGFCMSTGVCMTGTSAGPTYKGCSNWRYASSTSPLKTTQVCSAYQTCSSLSDCNTCTATAQDANSPCTWCSSSGGQSVCATAATACPNGATRLTTCPAQNTNGASCVTAGVMSFVGFLAVLGL